MGMSWSSLRLAFPEHHFLIVAGTEVINYDSIKKDRKFYFGFLIFIIYLFVGKLSGIEPVYDIQYLLIWSTVPMPVKSGTKQILRYKKINLEVV